jgi:hypothetical protein
MARETLEPAGPKTRPPQRDDRRRRIRRLVRRHPKLSVLLAFLAVALVAFVLVWFQPQKLFYDRTVNEALPGVIQTGGGSVPAAPSAPAPTTASASPAPQPALQVLASGPFRSLEHGTTGKALVLERADGRLILRLEDLDTSNGPDLRVYLSRVPAGDDWHAYAEGYVDLGALRGNRGSQNYAIPAGTDLSKFKSAVIWCRRFKVGFGVAALPQLATR